ncbi:MAG: HAMP domain-containing histidine kinase [Planctomycetes bacterium]|nr:HAMP domain-containing histidine kinase [Planctomycetota bacterium]
MTRHRLRAWGWFAATALPLVLALGWVTVSLLQLDRDEVRARQQASLHERVRLALWRMDSWLSPQLAAEAVRPASAYQAFPPARDAWTRGYSKLAADEVLVRSPLLGLESPRFLLHFEIGADGTLSSPQAPTGNQREVAVANGITEEVLVRAQQRLERLAPRLPRASVERAVGGAEAQLGMVGCNLLSADVGQQAQVSFNEFTNRQVANLRNQGQWLQDGVVAGATAAPVVGTALTPRGAVGPMLPFWLDGEPALLAIGRRVQDAGGVRLQGVVLDWAVLERELCALVGDLFAADCARLVRCEQPTPEQQPSMLAAVPARLCVDAGREVFASGLPTPWILGVTWSVALVGLVVLALLLRAAIGFGERRARFASAVTHELRTPLTTFRMYSEMLADGVVEDPVAQKEYLTTLQRESDRLSRVVENVLAWSRLEEGRFTSRRERHALPALVAAAEPVLRRRLDEAGMRLEVTVADSAAGASVVSDADAIGQILFNLVDNAAKYARTPGGKVELRVDGDPAAVRIAVRDHGPGVPAAHRRAVFEPFDRGAVQLSSNEVPGTGLGLPLARGLARDLGGDLVLDGSVAPGACFVLTLPRT